MTVLFEGFPRTLERSALRPGRWFVAADGMRPLLCLSTDVTEGPDLLAITFSAAGVEQLDVAHVALGLLPGPFGTVEDEIVFAPGAGDGRPMLAPPVRRAFRSGSLLRLRNGDLGIGFSALQGGSLIAVSLATGLRTEAFDLVFERWSLSLRRAGAETLIGAFKPLRGLADRKRI